MLRHKTKLKQYFGFMNDRFFVENRVVVTVGDITSQAVDAVVNAANWTLIGGGVDGAIHNKGGATILEACQKIRNTKYPKGLPTGKAVITTGGNLKAKYVIHTVGPIFGQNQGKDSALLADCYTNSLALAIENNLQTIAFPSISTGAFYYPKPEAAKVSSNAINQFLKQNANIKEVRLIFFSESDAKVFLQYQSF